MKSSHILNFSILFLIALSSALILSAFQQTGYSSPAVDQAPLPAQVTPTPGVEDQSEIGSTDGIVVLGILITLITITPLIFRRRKQLTG